VAVPVTSWLSRCLLAPIVGRVKGVAHSWSIAEPFRVSQPMFREGLGMDLEHGCKFDG
jgi:hypothetical protein